ncbi:dTMP kinase [Actinobaculum suis]|nr:dTMP kinase [Actinobaculum suis]
MTMGQGIFISFEGGDGAGKTTQAALLGQWLEAEGYKTLVTREPGGTPLGKRVRQMLLHGGEVAPRAEALLYAADRAQHVATLIRPALADGAIVITDRYIDSSIAYQGAGRDLTGIREISEWATGGLWPDITVLLDMPADIGLRRASKHAGADRIEAEGCQFHQEVRDKFLEMAKAESARYQVVDAAGTPEEIAQKVRAVIAPKLAGLRLTGTPGPAGAAGPAEAPAGLAGIPESGQL